VNFSGNQYLLGIHITIC